MNARPPIVAIEAKPWLSSKLNWLGIIQALIGILELAKSLLGSAPVDATTLIGPVQAPVEYGGLAWLVAGILTLVFRKMTNRPVAATKQLVDVPVKADAPSA